MAAELCPTERSKAATARQAASQASAIIRTTLMPSARWWARVKVSIVTIILRGFLPPTFAFWRILRACRGGA